MRTHSVTNAAQKLWGSYADPAEYSEIQSDGCTTAFQRVASAAALLGEKQCLTAVNLRGGRGGSLQEQYR
jgi:hypothetical protein